MEKPNPTDFNKIIAENIRIKREIKGLRQEDLAEQLNIAPSTYGKIERAETHIDIERLIQISQVFNVSIQEFLQLPESSENEIIHLKNNSHQHPPCITGKDLVVNLIKTLEHLPRVIEQQNQIIQTMMCMIQKNEKSGFIRIFRF